MKSLPKFSMESRQRNRKRVKISAALFAAVLVTAAMSICLGPVTLPLSQIGPVLLRQDTQSVAARIVLFSRLPRTCGTLLAGAALAVSGAVIQSVLENPLAAPNVIGVNAGAGLAVAICCAIVPGAL